MNGCKLDQVNEFVYKKYKLNNWSTKLEYGHFSLYKYVRCTLFCNITVRVVADIPRRSQLPDHSVLTANHYGTSYLPQEPRRCTTTSSCKLYWPHSTVTVEENYLQYYTPTKYCFNFKIM